MTSTAVLETFFRDRMHLIDFNNTVGGKKILTIENNFNNFNISITDNLVSCSCGRGLVCKHIKFVLEVINKIKKGHKKSKSYNSLADCQRVFYIDLKRELKPEFFDSDRNPRFRTYRDPIITEGSITEDIEEIITLKNSRTELEEIYKEKCYICLDQLSDRITNCKSCNKYYHDKCISSWLRVSPACKCPNCREMWM